MNFTFFSPTVLTFAIGFLPNSDLVPLRIASLSDTIMSFSSSNVTDLDASSDAEIDAEIYAQVCPYCETGVCEACHQSYLRYEADFLQHENADVDAVVDANADSASADANANAENGEAVDVAAADVALSESEGAVGEDFMTEARLARAPRPPEPIDEDDNDDGNDDGNGADELAESCYGPHNDGPYNDGVSDDGAGAAYLGAHEDGCYGDSFYDYSCDPEADYEPYGDVQADSAIVEADDARQIPSIVKMACGATAEEVAGEARRWLGFQARRSAFAIRSLWIIRSDALPSDALPVDPIVAIDPQANADQCWIGCALPPLAANPLDITPLLSDTLLEPLAKPKSAEMHQVVSAESSATATAETETSVTAARPMLRMAARLLDNLGNAAINLSTTLDELAADPSISVARRR